MTQVLDIKELRVGGFDGLARGGWGRPHPRKSFVDKGLRQYSGKSRFRM